MARTEKDKQEDLKLEAKEKRFHNKVSRIHKELLDESPDTFTVRELKQLLQIPEKIYLFRISKYTQEEFDILKKLRKSSEESIELVRSMNRPPRYR